MTTNIIYAPYEAFLDSGRITTIDDLSEAAFNLFRRKNFRDHNIGAAYLGGVIERVSEGYDFTKAPASFAVLVFRCLASRKHPLPVKSLDFVSSSIPTLFGESSNYIGQVLSKIVFQTEKGDRTVGIDGPCTIESLFASVQKEVSISYPELRQTEVVAASLKTDHETSAIEAVVTTRDKVLGKSWITIGRWPEAFSASALAVHDAVTFRLICGFDPDPPEGENKPSRKTDARITTNTSQIKLIH